VRHPGRLKAARRVCRSPLLKRIGPCLLGLLHCSVVWSLQSDLTLQQMNHRAFAATGGAPSEVLALAQATDGTLWVGGQTGLSRFDGLQFVRYPGPTDEPLQLSRVHRWWLWTFGPAMRVSTNQTRFAVHDVLECS